MRTFFILCTCSLFLFLSRGLDVVVHVEDEAQSDATNGNDECTAAASSANGGASCQGHSDCFDDDDDICFKRRHECNSDLFYMFIHCQKTCQVCIEDALPQNAGFDKIPMEVSIQVLQVARQTNLYYQSLNIPDYALSSFRDPSEMCAYWAFQGQCTNPIYREYMQVECPVTCQVYTLFQARAFVQFLAGDLQEAYIAHENNVLESRKAALSLLMTRLQMDPSLIGMPLDSVEEFDPDGNWVEELHARLHAVIPPALLHLYDMPEGPIDDQDLAFLAELHGFLSDSPREVVLTNILVQYRSRGYIVNIMRDVDHYITRPIQVLVGFAVPNDEAIQRLKQLSPLLQMGAGSGYWAGILRQHNIDVVAYDLHPPSMQGNKNEFFDSAYISDIQEGACVESMTSELASNRTLLLIWPNDPDPIDNEDFCQDDACQDSQAVWDTDCLEAFVQAGGHRVIFVGERATAISGDASADSGLSATRRFQDMLEKDFVLVDTIAIPHWWLNEDDLTIWEKK